MKGSDGLVRVTNDRLLIHDNEQQRRWKKLNHITSAYVLLLGDHMGKPPPLERRNAIILNGLPAELFRAAPEVSARLSLTRSGWSLRLRRRAPILSATAGRELACFLLM